jgi:hypothetical protein
MMEREMGTRADFYVGQGPDAEWIGSIALDGYREGIPPVILHAVNETFYRNAVCAFLAASSSGTTPDQGWPWPWDDSSISDCSYWFFDGKTHDARRLGGQEEWLVPCSVDLPDDEDEKQYEAIKAQSTPITAWPNMSSKAAVTMGKRSGLIVLSA